MKYIRTDNGTEFAGLDKFCRLNGTVHQKTAPYAHQQNGKIERLNRTLQEKARVMLAASDLPSEYWGDALLTANYLRNISAVANSDKTPFEMWFGTIPDVSHLRVFGSKCFVMFDKSKRDGKFNHVSQEGIFLGYDGFSKNYRICVDSKVGVHCREYVRFEEKVIENIFSDMPDLADMTDDEEDVSTDSEVITIEGGVTDELPAVSLTPLEDTERITRFDRMVLDMSNALGITHEQDTQATKDGEKGPTGKQDLEELDPCSTSGLDPLTEVVSHEREREKILNLNLSPLNLIFKLQVFLTHMQGCLGIGIQQGKGILIHL